MTVTALNKTNHDNLRRILTSPVPKLGTVATISQGCVADALRLVEELKERKQKGYVPAGAFVNAYLGLGDNEEALAWLEKAHAEHSNIVQWMKVHPFMDPLREDPRFKDLLHQVGLDKTY
jgi:hypothetical protein